MIIEKWARAGSAADLAATRANHADDLLIFDFPATAQEWEVNVKARDLFFAHLLGPIRFVPSKSAATASNDIAFASRMVYCEGTFGGSDNFRLTTGLRKTGGKWVIVHEHHSVPTKEERFIGPS